MSNGCCGSQASCCNESNKSIGITVVDGTVSRNDRLARLGFRLGFRRKKRTVRPGLYALGPPGPEDPVIVSGNFRITFDLVRSALKGRNLWILILDTRGINVWCAAGEGTFGTDELVERIDASGLKKMVTHRRLILPQLGAPGIQAHRVEEITGFRVLYGPVSVGDLPRYLDNGRQGTPDMRHRGFPLKERLELVPVELIQSWKALLVFSGVSILLTSILESTGNLSFLFDLLPAVLAVICGTVITPLLLPCIPGRAFALKGAVVGGSGALLFFLAARPTLSRSVFLFLSMTMVSSFLAMNFTGASTFTSLSGVRKEMRVAVPLQASFFCAAVVSRVLLEVGIEWFT